MKNQTEKLSEEKSKSNIFKTANIIVNYENHLIRQASRSKSSLKRFVTMAPCEVSATVAATPDTIWQTCFEPMKWEQWDPDCEYSVMMIFCNDKRCHSPLIAIYIVSNFVHIMYSSRYFCTQ